LENYFQDRFFSFVDINFLPIHFKTLAVIVYTYLRLIIIFYNFVFPKREYLIFMKKFILLSLTFVLFVVAQAAPVTQLKALDIAQQFMGKSSSTTSGALRVKSQQLTLAHQAMGKNGEVDFYVFNCNDDNGFILVSGDDMLTPVLGYTDSGNFDISNIPDGLGYWLSEYQREIEYLKEHPDQVRKAPTYFTRNVRPLLSTNWNQSAPYNNYTPLYDGTNHCATGCVATAAAQIMKYYNYPPQGKGSNTYSIKIGDSDTETTLSEDFSKSVYEWDLMDDNYNSNSPESHNAAVAKLMSDVGIAAKMHYGPSSGAGNPNLANALINNFSYDKSLRMEARGNYGIEEWEQMLINELNSRRPIYYTGYTPTGGHAFVFDGYNTDGYFHVNWGWGGSSNGYFIVSMLNPSNQGIGSFEGGYNSGQAVIINIKPDQGGEAEVRPLKAACTIKPLSESVAVGSEVKIDCSNVCMGGTKNWTSKLYWGVVCTPEKENATVSDVINGPYLWCNATGVSTGIGYGATLSYYPQANMAPGKYQLRLLYNIDDSMYGLFDGSCSSDYIIDMEIKDGNAYFTQHVPASSLTAEITKLSGTIVYANQPFEVTADITNSGEEYYNDIYVGILQDGIPVSVSDAMKIAIPRNGTFTLKSAFSPEVETGQYQVAILDYDLNVLGSTPVTVSDNNGLTPSLTLYTNVKPSQNEMPANEIVATCQVRNNSSATYAGYVELFICQA